MSAISHKTVRATEPPIARTRRSICMHVLGNAPTDVRVMRAATALNEAGFAVSIVDINWQEGGQENIDGIEIKHVQALHWQSARRFKLWFLLQACWMFVRCVMLLWRTPADVYHAHDAKALPACYLASLLRRRRLVFDSHELPLSEEMTLPRWKGLIGPFSKMLAFIVPRCAGVITVSAPIAQEIHRRYAGPEVTLVRNIPPLREVTESDCLRNYLGVGAQTHIALYQGGLGASRGLDRLIRAARYLEEDTLLVLMGPDSEGLQGQYEAVMRDEGVSERVKIVPSVPYEELLNWTASADIGLLVYAPGQSQNIQMCLPNKLFEYLMVGLPVLASELEAVVDILTTYAVGRVLSSLEPVDVAAAINALLADSSAREQMRRNALVASKTDLCWEKESQQLLRLYKDIFG